MLQTLSFIANHPLTRDRPVAAFRRFAKWQLQSRLQNEIAFPWVGGASLVVANGMRGATGNIYCGLHEFTEMGFLLHLLRPNDLFVDIGANVGTYTVLASAVVGALAIAAEPDPNTMKFLRRNLDVNEVSNRVTSLEVAVGKANGSARFTVGLDTINHITYDIREASTQVLVNTLDHILRGHHPLLIKLDVEGFEADVVAGATETLQKASLLAVQTECIESGVSEPLVAAGFHRVHYDPFFRRLSDKAMHREFNALFVRNREEVEARLQAAHPVSILGQNI